MSLIKIVASHFPLSSPPPSTPFVHSLSLQKWLSISGRLRRWCGLTMRLFPAASSWHQLHTCHRFEPNDTRSISTAEMSRHKLVKALDLDEELDDYDGAGYDGQGDEELTPEDKEHLRRATVEVRNTLGLDFPATDQEIEYSLYYYYYDVQKTVHYLLSMYCEIKSREVNY